MQNWGGQTECIMGNWKIVSNAPYLPPPPPPPREILPNLCFPFLLSITAVPTKIENNAYANAIRNPESLALVSEIQLNESSLRPRRNYTLGKSVCETALKSLF